MRLRGDDPCGSPTDVHFNEVSEALGIAHRQVVALMIPRAACRRTYCWSVPGTGSL